MCHITWSGPLDESNRPAYTESTSHQHTRFTYEKGCEDIPTIICPSQQILVHLNECLFKLQFFDRLLVQKTDLSQKRCSPETRIWWGCAHTNTSLSMWSRLGWGWSWTSQRLTPCSSLCRWSGHWVPVEEGGGYTSVECFRFSKALENPFGCWSQWILHESVIGKDWWSKPTHVWNSPTTVDIAPETYQIEGVCDAVQNATSPMPHLCQMPHLYRICNAYCSQAGQDWLWKAMLRACITGLSVIWRWCVMPENEAVLGRCHDVLWPTICGLCNKWNLCCRWFS